MTTHLARLIEAHTEAATVTTITRATELIAEEMARELLQEPEFRAELKTLVREAFSTTVRALNAPAPTRARRKK